MCSIYYLHITLQICILYGRHTQGCAFEIDSVAKFLKVGDDMEPGTVFGPVQNKPQYLRVKALMDEPRAGELTLLEGRAVPHGNGYFWSIIRQKIHGS